MESLESAILARSPLDLVDLRLGSVPTGLLAIDEVVGFCVPGAGPLAPPAKSEKIEAMVAETDRLARLVGRTLAFRDSHPPGQVEAPYPPHCVQGTGHDELVQPLAWLADDPGSKVLAKDCIDAVLGAARPDGGNDLFDWVVEGRLERLVVVGICTDICVLSAVSSLLSARSRGMLGPLVDIVVHEPGCATYDLPLPDARGLGLPDRAAHPAGLYHAMGLLAMQNQGAVVSRAISR